MKITKQNFYENTVAIFKKVDSKKTPNRNPDYVSESGSKYWYTNAGVFRLADHWEQVASCYWVLSFSNISQHLDTVYDEPLLGFCEWVNFYPLVELILDDSHIGKEFLFCEFDHLFKSTIELNAQAFNDKYKYYIACHPQHLTCGYVRIVDFTKSLIQQYEI